MKKLRHGITLLLALILVFSLGGTAFAADRIKCCEQPRIIPETKAEAFGKAALDIKEHGIIALIGPNGSGKTTLLRMIAGLGEITEEAIRIGDRTVNDVEPKDRDIAMVFQNYALYPHMTVYDNMAFALKLRKVPKEEIGRTAEDELSGGETQRVKIACPLKCKHEAVCKDEAISDLDAKLRVAIRTEITKLQRRIGETSIYVTSDRTDLKKLADRIAVVKDGFIQQIGAPQEQYNKPENLFVAGFIGTPQMNFLEGVVKGVVEVWKNSAEIIDGAADSVDRMPSIAQLAAGGFCNWANELLSVPDIDGGLIGGAALKSDFMKIVQGYVG